MATFVRVHPAWFGGWCWKKVTPLLRARGHDVYSPTRTGLGERAHLARPDVGLETHIEDVVRVLTADRRWRCLCGRRAWDGSSRGSLQLRGRNSCLTPGELPTRLTCVGCWPALHRPPSGISRIPFGARIRRPRNRRVPTFAACSGPTRASIVMQTWPDGRRGGGVANWRLRTSPTSRMPVKSSNSCSKPLRNWFMFES